MQKGVTRVGQMENDYRNGSLPRAPVSLMTLYQPHSCYWVSFFLEFVLRGGCFGEGEGGSQSLHVYVSSLICQHLQICSTECDEDAEVAAHFVRLCYHSEGCPGYEGGRSDRGETPQCTAAAEHTRTHHPSHRTETQECQHPTCQAAL